MSSTSVSPSKEKKSRWGKKKKEEKVEEKVEAP